MNVTLAGSLDEGARAKKLSCRVQRVPREKSLDKAASLRISASTAGETSDGESSFVGDVAFPIPRKSF